MEISLSYKIQISNIYALRSVLIICFSSNGVLEKSSFLYVRDAYLLHFMINIMKKSNLHSLKYKYLLMENYTLHYRLLRFSIYN